MIEQRAKKKDDEPQRGKNETSGLAIYLALTIASQKSFSLNDLPFQSVGMTIIEDSNVVQFRQNLQLTFDWSSL